MRRLVLSFMVMFTLSVAWAAAGLSDPASEKRYEAFTHALRCLKCEHQSIAESDSDFAKDVKLFLVDSIVAGRSDQEIKDMLKSRFGDRIFLDPPWQLNTYVLWFAPIMLCLLGVLFWWRRMRS